LHVDVRGAKTDACGRKIAVLSTQVSTGGLLLRYGISACCPGRCPRRHVNA
jgi:hypothetical protein